MLLTDDRKLLVSGIAGGSPETSLDDAGYWALLNLEGDTLWQHTDSSFRPASVIEAHDEGYIAIANDATTIAGLRNDGTIAWKKQYDQIRGAGSIISPGGDGAIVAVGDGYLVVGATRDEDYKTRMVAMGIDAEGNPRWTSRLHAGTATDVLALEDGSFLVFGVEVTDDHDTSPSIRFLPYATRIDSTGQKMWEKTYSCRPRSFPVAATRLPDGDVVMAGSFDNEQGDGRVLQIRIRPDGEVVYSNCK
ncbi:MAG: hypothetical protein ACR2GR_08665 [Rhodothermales bacterium]